MKTIEELRSEFEHDEVIKLYTKMYCVFVNGAWYMFQELKNGNA